MADLGFDKKGLAGLEKDLGQQLKKVGVEAARAATRGSAPQGKARAFARVLVCAGTGSMT